MNKKSCVALSTIALLSSSALAQLQFPEAPSNCTGYFYENINAAFLDCYDEAGVLQSRQDNFY